MSTEIPNAIDAPTEEQIKEHAMGYNREFTMEDCVNKYKRYMDAIDTINRITRTGSFCVGKDGMFGDLGQKIIVEIIGSLGCEVDPVMPDISNKYVALLNKALEKCPFTKEQALEWSKETLAEEPTKRGFWAWLFG